MDREESGRRMVDNNDTQHFLMDAMVITEFGKKIQQIPEMTKRRWSSNFHQPMVQSTSYLHSYVGSNRVN